MLPVYLTLTEEINRNERTIINRKGIITAGVILIIFAFIGNLIFKFYGITIYAFRIVGGILFFRIGLSMIESKISRIKATPKEEEEALQKEIFAYTPLAIPIIAGPGSITSVMILSSQIEHSIDKVIFVGVLIIVLLITYGIFQTAGRVSSLLGTIGLRIMQRIMGLLLMVIAVQFIIDGITPIVQEWINNS
jgi:multiple antibiotic resistance protein